MLSIQNLKYSYDGQVNMSFPDFDIQSGEEALILGQSGCGKTTLLHLMSGLLGTSNGAVLVDGQDINKLKGGVLDSFRGKKIGIVFQVAHFIDSLTVKENLMLTQKLAGVKQNIDSITTLLSELGVVDKLNKKVKQLSVGEKQRVSIARALVNNPKVILADEPTSALDDGNCTAVLKLLRKQAEKMGACLLIVTHDNRLKELFDKTITLN